MSKENKEDKSQKKVMSKREIDEALINNFVNLQKVLTNLSVKFDELSSNISKMLQLFELSAKSFADKTNDKSGVDQEFLKKLDALLDQNKVISKGIMMMEEKVRNKMEPNFQSNREMFRPRPPSTTRFQ